MLDECEVSGNRSEDELEEATQFEHINDSIICISEENDDPEYMHAKYLQSIRYNRNSLYDSRNNVKCLWFLHSRSPNCRPGAFIIPERRNYMNISNVFSQVVLPETTVLDVRYFACAKLR